MLFLLLLLLLLLLILSFPIISNRYTATAHQIWVQQSLGKYVQSCFDISKFWIHAFVLCYPYLGILLFILAAIERFVCKIKNWLIKLIYPTCNNWRALIFYNTNLKNKNFLLGLLASANQINFNWDKSVFISKTSVHV